MQRHKLLFKIVPKLGSSPFSSTTTEPVINLPIAKLAGDNGQLKKIVFKNGESHDCDAIFFVNGYTQQCDLVETFGCEMSKKGVAKANKFQQTNIPGLYVAGDASRDMHFVVVAGAEGAKAGVTINKELQKEITEKKNAAAQKIEAVV